MDLLPPSYVCDVGQGGKISCSYSMQINVTQKSRHAFWHNRNRSVGYLFPLRHIFPLDPLRSCLCLICQLLRLHLTGGIFSF